MGIFNDNSQNLSGGKGPAGRDGIGFKLTDDGNYDIDGKRLTNLAKPKDNSDAATKNYVDTKIPNKILLLIVKLKRQM